MGKYVSHREWREEVVGSGGKVFRSALTGPGSRETGEREELFVPANMRFVAHPQLSIY